MELFFGGDYNQMSFIINGLQISEKLTAAFNSGGHLRWMVILFSFGSFLFYIAQAIQKKVAIGIPFLYLILMPFWLQLSFNTPVDISIGSAPFESPLAAEESSLKLQIQNLEKKIKAAEENGTTSQTAARQDLEAKKSRLKMVSKFANASEKTLGQAPLPVAYLYNLSQAASLGLWAVLNDAHPSDLAGRRYQTLMLNNVSQDVQLSPEERNAAAQISNCLTMKSMLVTEIGKQAQRVAQGSPRYVDQRTEGAAKEILSYRKWVEEACNSVTKTTMDSIDKSITPEEIKLYESSYDIASWIPLIGGATFGKKDDADKLKFIESQLHLTKEQLKKMSSAEISKTFIRQKHLEKMSSDWQDGLIDPPSGLRNSSGMDPAGFKSSAGSIFTDWMADFMLAFKPYLKLTISWAWHFALICGAVMCLIALIPKYHLAAPLGYAFALLFLGVWQVTVNYIELYSSKLEAQEVIINSPATNPLNYVGRLAAGAIDELTGDLEPTDAAAAVAIGAKPAIKTGFAAWSLKGIRTVLAKTPTSAIVGTVATGVGYAGYQSYVKETAATDSYESMLSAASTSINPAFSALYSGLVTQQRNTVKQARSHAKMMEAILLMASPLITLIFFFGGYKMLSGLGVGAAASSAAGALGNTIGGSAVGKLGLIGGGVGRPGGGK